MPWKARGDFNGNYYATVQTGEDDSDWFHAPFDETVIPFEKQKEIFDWFKNSEENHWHGKNHKLVVKHEGFSTGGNPIKPVIIEITLDK